MGALRRISPRLQNIPEEKRPYYGPDRKRSNDKEEDTVVSTKKTKLNKSKKPCSPNPSRKSSRVKNKGDEASVVSDVSPNARGETGILDVNGDETAAVSDVSPNASEETGILDAKGDETAAVSDVSPNASEETGILDAKGDETAAVSDVSPNASGETGILDAKGYETAITLYVDPNASVETRVLDEKGDETAVVSDIGLNASGETRILDANHDEKWSVANTSLINDQGINYMKRVKETSRLFNGHYLQFVKIEEERSKEAKNRREGDDNVKRPSKRPDLKAIKKMLKDGTVLHTEKSFGHLPGINVGHQFFSRTEMVAVGIHGHWLSGICFIGVTEGKKKFKDSGYIFPLAVAIVLSGQYEDDVDNSEEIVYTGQGGNDLLGNKRQIKDQVMKSGNLALKNNMEQSLPIRVIRGNKCTNSISGRVYTYDGLYKVDHYWAERGVSGFTVFKYRLKRLPGQPELVTNQVHFVRGKGSQAQSEIHGLVCKDISYGRENIPIAATNIVDDSPEVPEGFTYINSLEVASNVKIPPSARGCTCKEECTDPRTCSCAKRNPSDFPYVKQDGGRLVEAMDVVFECGPFCGCGPKCVNRTSQKGLKYRLEVYKTPDKGWGVRSWDYIPSGAPVCEYIGVVRRTDELVNVTNNEYIFEIDCLQTINEIGGRERRLRDVALPTSSGFKRGGKASENVPEFCIDAGSRGNVARFINHSCEPNLFVQCVLSSHHDIRLARVVLFAADNIVPLQELTYDYGFELDSIVGPDGKLKKLACHCGAPTCRKRLY